MDAFKTINATASPVILRAIDDSDDDDDDDASDVNGLAKMITIRVTKIIRGR